VPQTIAVTSPSFPAHRAEPNRAGFAPVEGSVPVVRHDWSAEEAAAIYHAPFMDLLLRAQAPERQGRRLPGGLRLLQSVGPS
jgi:hypothetical protein